MLAINSTHKINPINTEMSPAACLEVMVDLRCFELPVYKNNQLWGTIDFQDCINSPQKTIDSLVKPGCVSVYYLSHIFDVLALFKASPKGVFAVLGENQEWLGILTKDMVVDSLSASLSIEQTGAILILEMSSSQYSSNEISRIVEGEGFKVLGLWLHQNDESARIKVTIKINTSNIERIINGFDRFGYVVLATFGDEDYQENVKQKFLTLMKYIDY